MIKPAKIAIFSFFGAMAAGFSLFSAAHAAELLDVRFGPSATKTRIVFDLKGGADYVISGDAGGKGRIFVDFSSLELAKADRIFRPGKGHVARYGFADSGAAGVRAVIELKNTAAIKAVFMIQPAGKVTKHRLVIDLQTADRTAFLASLPSRYPDLAAVIEDAIAQPATTRETITPPSPSHKEVTAPAAIKRQIIVIDAGHGGADPGAQGQSGTYEKTVTLAAAKELAAILKKRGRYEVVFTRKGDTTIRPDKREALARKADADLFISLHADAIAQKQVRGASIYTLDEKGAVRSATLAKTQGDYHVYDLDLEKYDQVVGDILFDKAQETTYNESAKLARALIANLGGKTPMLNRSHRTADLRVLLAPDVPAVLLEMAFISNAKDEANMNSKTWRKRAMTAVADSIDQYFAESGLQQQAANRTGGAQ